MGFQGLFIRIWIKLKIVNNEKYQKIEKMKLKFAKNKINIKINYVILFKNAENLQTKIKQEKEILYATKRFQSGFTLSGHD